MITSQSSSSAGYYGPASTAAGSSIQGRAKDDGRTIRRRKELSEQELFEAQQLIRSGVLPVEQYPTYDAEGGMGRN
jgi:hypothetical protein